MRLTFEGRSRDSKYKCPRCGFKFVLPAAKPEGPTDRPPARKPTPAEPKRVVKPPPIPQPEVSVSARPRKPEPPVDKAPPPPKTISPAGKEALHASSGAKPAAKTQPTDGPTAEETSRPVRFPLGPVVGAVGTLLMLVSMFLPFYAKGELDPTAPGILHFWTVGDFGSRLLIVVQLTCLIPAVIAIVRPTRSISMPIAVVASLCAFAATRVLAAERARDLAMEPESVVWGLAGLGLGAILYMFGSAGLLAFGLWAGRLKVWPLKVGAPAVAVVTAIILTGVAFGSLHAWQTVSPQPFDLTASTQLAHDVFGREVPRSVSLRLTFTNQSEQPVVAVRNGTIHGTAGEGPVYFIRVKLLAEEGQAWQEVQDPVWSGVWPRLDFRQSLSLAPGESWSLESLLYRGDVQSACECRPRKVAIEVLDERGIRCMQRCAEVDSPLLTEGK